ncbi:Mrp/NBP35 family ATP-binding protein [Paenibacillus sp. TRM 82003]|uniref:Mrp/NBP35 family ATP-binding protein n=1 Tax=Kineococcus sp. TRM81007 TaxID=2925831 RepID=UPI001F597F36|nr:Mrp/NBP35 family ATP-binding protein [Kineococcus sp. TRM81007]MCI2239184.1 Mrp/NBP35 family ATP-binding protein [Kineococcus sp. TRM81007]MCI3924863.1 Mrp/NBP35 family ATP-binding protein [Paenibacillus sp. TRM 82003]
MLPTPEDVRTALSAVNDPELHRPITELGMVERVDVGADAVVDVEVLLTIAGCPMREKLTSDVTAAVRGVPGARGVRVRFGVMSPEQRSALTVKLRGTTQAAPTISFNEPGNLTRVYAVASGKGGVGKSSVTVNLAAAMAADGLRVGVVDADVHGFSVPRLLGVTGRPTKVDSMILPPTGHGVRVISIGMFVPGNEPVAWRGPMLHRALQQFVSEVFWGDLDVLLLDLPPGTGDIAISVGQLLPSAEVLVVTTPQAAAAEVAERAGAVAAQTSQRVVGVVENMSWLELPDGQRLEVFGSGGGERVAASLTERLGAPVPLLGRVPMDVTLREGGDAGLPVVLGAPDSPAAQALRELARTLAARPRGLAGRRLGVSVA